MKLSMDQVVTLAAAQVAGKVPEQKTLTEGDGTSIADRDAENRKFEIAAPKIIDSLIEDVHTGDALRGSGDVADWIFDETRERIIAALGKLRRDIAGSSEG